MKTWLIFLNLLLITSFLSGQNVPFSINYQLALKDDKGAALSDKDIQLRFQILKGSLTGNEVFNETQGVRSNESGIVQTQIGRINSGDLAAIDFFSDAYFLRVSVDGKEIGTSQLVSVPYAIVAQKALQLNLKAQPGQVLKFDGNSWVPAQDNVGSGGKISLFGDVTGDTDQAKVIGLQGRPISSISPFTDQYLRWDGSQWIPFNLPTDTWGNQVVVADKRMILGNGTQNDPLTWSSLGAVNGDVIKWDGNKWVAARVEGKEITQLVIAGDVEGPITASKVSRLQNLPVSSVVPQRNQFLKWDGSSWIADNLPSGNSDNWGSQVVVTDNSLSGNGTGSSPLGLSNFNAAKGDVIKWDGNKWIASRDSVAVVTNLSLQGDLSGTTASARVERMQGFPISNVTPIPGQVLKWNGTSWIPALDSEGLKTILTDPSLKGDGSMSNPLGLSALGATLPNQFPSWDGSKWVVADRLVLNGDLSGFTSTARTIGLQGRPVASANPASGQVLKFTGSSWTPSADLDNQTLILDRDSLRISNGNAVSLTNDKLWIKIPSTGKVRNAENGSLGINMIPDDQAGLYLPDGNTIRLGDTTTQFASFNSDIISLVAKTPNLADQSTFSASALNGIGMDIKGSRILEMKPALVSGKTTFAGRISLLHSNGSILLGMGQRDTSESLGFLSVYNKSRERIRLSSSLDNNGGQFQIYGKNDSTVFDISTIARGSDIGSFPVMKLSGYGKTGVFLGYTQVGSQYFPLMSFGTPSLDASNPSAPVRIYVSGTDQRGQIEVSGNILCNSGMKCFVMDHPADPKSTITYACVEGPEAGAYERGTATLVNGRAEVRFSDHYAQVINPSTLTVQLTPISLDSKGLALIEKNSAGFIVGELNGGKGNYSFDWEVKGVRKGFENFQVVKSKVPANQ